MAFAPLYPGLTVITSLSTHTIIERVEVQTQLDARYFEKATFVDAFTGNPAEPVKTDSTGRLVRAILEEVDAVEFTG